MQLVWSAFVNTALLIVLFVLLVAGAILPPGNILHSFAVAFDMFCQDLFWNAPIGVTISSRAGLAARRGKAWPARIVNAVMLSRTHCEDAIATDIQRAEAAVALLKGQP